MKKIILDTNFILTCAKQKIDFLEWLETNGYEILIPSNVIEEIEKIIKSRKEIRFRDAARISAILIKSHEVNFIDLKGKNVDNSIVNFAKQNPDMLVATLDREIQGKIKNKKLIIRGKKKLEII